MCVQDRNTYSSFYPRYFEWLGLQGYHRAWIRAIGAVLLFTLTQHHLLSLFFALPTEDLLRTHRSRLQVGAVMWLPSHTVAWAQRGHPKA